MTTTYRSCRDFRGRTRWSTGGLERHRPHTEGRVPPGPARPAVGLAKKLDERRPETFLVRSVEDTRRDRRDRAEARAGHHGLVQPAAVHRLVLLQTTVRAAERPQAAREHPRRPATGAQVEMRFKIDPKAPP